MSTKSLTKTVKKNNASSLTSGIINLPDLEAQLNKLWSLFMQQTERNSQLMTMLQQQQDLALSFPAVVAPMPLEPKEDVPHYASLNVPEITLSKLRVLEPLMRDAIGNQQKRFPAVQSLINMVHCLYHLNGEAYAEQLFGLIAISKSGGYRLVSELRMAKLTDVKNGKLVLTDYGRRFYENKLTPEDVTSYRNHF